MDAQPLVESTSETTRSVSEKGRARLPLTRDVIELVAVSHGVCIHPVPLRQVDPDTGQSAIVDVPCGATSTSKCPPCAERARLLRMQQCRQGWHLDEEPVVEDVDPTDEQTDLATMRADLQAALVKAEDAGLPTEPISEAIEDIEGQLAASGLRGQALPSGAASSSSVHQAPPGRPGPAAPAGGCHDGGPHVHRTGRQGVPALDLPDPDVPLLRPGQLPGRALVTSTPTTTRPRHATRSTSPSWSTGSGRTCAGSSATRSSTSPPSSPSDASHHTCTRPCAARSPAGSSR